MSNIAIGKPTRHGSAEVLARGIDHAYNHFMDVSSLNHFADNLAWFEQFPTVVRTGNFVFCMRNRDVEGYWVRPRYRLIDIVPDPEEPNRLGNNLAYPYITNTDGVTGDRSRYIPWHTKNASTTDSPPGPFSNGNHGYESTLHVTQKVLEFTNNNWTADFPEGPGMLSSSYHLDLAVPIFEDGRWVGCDQINAQDQYIWGVGDYMIHRDKDQADVIGNKDFTYEYTHTTSYYGTRFFFAPVVDAEQFATLYGEERIWGQPHQNHDWLYVGYPDQTRSGARTEPKYPGGIPYYPFDIETPIGAGFGYSEPEVEERTDIDVGDGPDLADVLKGAAVGTAIACNKDLIDKAVEKAKAELKNMASTVMEAGSTALLELQEKADGVKADLVAKLPEIPEKITNVHDAITSLDLADLGAVQAFKEKYGDLVDDIDGLLSKFKLPDFDICSLLSISHEKSTPPESPTTAPLEPARNNSVPQVGASQPISNDSGLTKENAEEANRTIDQAWKRVEAADSGDGGKAYLAEAVNARRREITEVDAFYSVTDLKMLEPEELVGGQPAQIPDIDEIWRQRLDVLKQ